MKIKHEISIAYKTLLSHKVRSFLTILGIVIGITAIILILSLGRGAQKLILAEIESIGSNILYVTPGREPKGPNDFAEVFTNSLKEKDIKALMMKSNVPTLASLMPFILGADSARYENESYRASMYGMSELVTKFFNINTEEGEFFTRDDVQNNRDIAVLGARVKEKLFDNVSPIGKKIKVKNKNLKIIGVLPKKGQISLFGFDEAVIIPYTTAQNYLGIKYFMHFIIEATSAKEVPQTVRDVERTLRATHNITDPKKDDFYVETQEDVIQRFNIVSDIMTIFLMSVAAISLIVGGVGIMNIMLVSVAEKSREVGLRKSLGATNKDIFMQFLAESIILTGVGGITGIILGWTFSFLASLAINQFLPSWKFNFPPSSILLGISVSSAVGIIFGLFPAYKASRKNPIDALRYE